MAGEPLRSIAQVDHAVAKDAFPRLTPLAALGLIATLGALLFHLSRQEFSQAAVLVVLALLSDKRAHPSRDSPLEDAATEAVEL